MTTPTKEQQLEALDRVANTLRLEASGLAVARKNELAMKEMFDAAEVLQHIRDQIASAELNQCDGCRTGFVLDGDMHRWADGSPYMICQRGRYYAPQPAPAAVPDDWQLVPKEFTREHFAAMLGRRLLNMDREPYKKLCDDYAAFLAAAPSLPAVDRWQPIKTAPKDGTLVFLAVEADDSRCCPLEDTAALSRTIGFNNFEDDGEDVWKFAGWNWESDFFTEGRGNPNYWMPIPAPPKPDAERAIGGGA